jgi:hypothetical protein
VKQALKGSEFSWNDSGGKYFLRRSDCEQVFRRDRYVAKTTITTTIQATMYSVELSTLARLIAVSRPETNAFTI